MNYWSSFVFVWFLLMYPVYLSSGNIIRNWWPTGC